MLKTEGAMVHMVFRNMLIFLQKNY